jgi:hypothetical protein
MPPTGFEHAITAASGRRLTTWTARALEPASTARAL